MIIDHIGIAVKNTRDPLANSKHGFEVLLVGAEGITGKGIWTPDLNKEIKKRGIPLPKTTVLNREQFQKSEALRPMPA